MRPFVALLLSHLRALPANLRSGLNPGARSDDTPPQRLRRNFVYHLHPLRVTLRALKLSTTFGLGLATLTLLLVLLVSGLLLALYYVPTPAQAYDSMLDIQHAATFGRFVRLVHRFAAHACVPVAILHLVRVLAVAAYRRCELNWLIGLCMLALLLGLALTGYLLPWDQTSYWAVRIVASMLDHVPLLGDPLKRLLLGGDQVTGATLLRFYALHVALLPFSMLVLVALHIWRIRRVGGLARPATEDPPTVSAWPHLVLREAVVVLAVIGLVALAALALDAPLGAPADILRPSNPEKAPWYFVGVQEMVSYSAVVGGFVFPALMLLLLLGLPYVDRQEDHIGRLFGAHAERRTLMVVALAAITLVVGLELVYLHPDLAARGAGLATWVQDLANPAAFSLLFCVVVFFWVGAKTGSTRPAARSSFVVLGVSLLLFTVTGLCRGPDWTFYWPWEEWPRGF